MNTKHRPPERPEAQGPTPKLRHLSVTTDLDAPVDVNAIAAAAELSPAERDAFTARVERMRAQLTKHEDQLAAFKADPFGVAGATFKELGDLSGIARNTLGPTGMDAGCAAQQAASAALASCARSLLLRTAQWSALSSANRATMEANSDTAVDAVAGGFPAEAVVLAKSALRSARTTP